MPTFASQTDGKDIVMKTLPIILLLIAGFALVLAGCSDSSSSPVAPNGQANPVSTPPPSLAKGGPVVHSATGSGSIFYGGKTATFAFTAHKYADGSCDGEYQLNTHYQDPEWGKWHGRVTSLEVYNGNTAVIGGIETNSSFQGYYDAIVVQDNGEGKKDLADKYTCTVLWTDSKEYAQQVWAMPPNQVINEIVKECISLGWIVTADTIFVPVQMGNIQVK